MVVMAAKRVSPIPSGGPWLGLLGPPMSVDVLRGEPFGESVRLRGRHLSTASMEARQGWTWRG